MRFIRKIFITLLATIVKVAATVYRMFCPVGRMFRAALRILGRLLFTLALPIYGVTVSLKRTLWKFYAPLEQRTRILHLFTRRFFFHLTFIIIALTVVAANLNASEVKRDEFVYSNVFTNLSQGDEFGDIEEVLPPETPSIQRSLGSAAVGRGINADSGAAQETVPGTIAGGSALVKPVRLASGQVSGEELPAGIPRTEVTAYAVQNGDTISGVAMKFGVSINTILWENNLTAYSIIRPGQTLTILPISGVRHKVAKGDVLGKIATKYNVKAEDIIATNKLASADDLQIGELLLIPGGQKPRPVPTYVLRRPSAPAAPASGSGHMVWPNECSRITQYYGWRHTGLDIACAYGSSVYAAASGRVIKAQGGWNGGYGIMVVIEHASGLQTL
ncbi:MAG: LysM peptidoglycan-binding domain-containing protein, partial [Patescibacteria group bacterium]|nr:LysM peptidoglycan-binding domain-containing protein [Patescibacteria group bacterium]